MEDHEAFWGVMAAWAALAVLAIPILILARDREVLLGVFALVMVSGNLAAFFVWATRDAGHGHGRGPAEGADDARVIIIGLKKDEETKGEPYES